ncbi:MAG: archaemetzincin [Thermoanaerobaculum sp.]|nr:archaemetzincin [Thermoanaerobaculum sp.]
MLHHESLPPATLGQLLSRLPAPFQIHRKEPWQFPDHVGFDPYRQQSNALELLRTLPTPGQGEAVLGLVGIDLYLPSLTFVFGLSLLGQRQGLLSSLRLRPDNGDALLWQRRVLVEAVHELGHAVGLVHCPLASCAMHQSFHPEAVDLKEPAYCPACLSQLSALLGSQGQGAGKLNRN